MKYIMAVILFIGGLIFGFLLHNPKPQIKVVTETKTVVVTKEVTKQSKCPVCRVQKPQQPPIPPSLVLDLVKACRAGTLDQSDPNITVLPKRD